jgi:3-hydroxyisobutyrate dehydrogenase
MRVGFIGIGNMGWPMTANIRKAGHEVIVHDTDLDKCRRFVAEHGGTVAERLPALAAAEFVITMLPTGQIVRDVYLSGQDGGLAKHLRSGTIAIDMSSSDPPGTRTLGAALAKHGVTLLDAPVSGAVPRAKTGTLTIMIGGDDTAAIEQAKPLLASMGDRLFETGSLGSGHAVKALNNFVAASCYSAAAEALLIGKRFGLDQNKILDIINVSTGRNFNTELIMKEHVVGQKFATGFALGLLAKDVRIAADLARAVNFDGPMSKLVSERYALACDRLGAARDNSEAILSWDLTLKDSE